MIIDSSTVCYITGAGSGLGLECARLFLKKGCSVVLCDLKWTEEAEALMKENQSKILQLALDITSEEQIRQTVERAIQEYKKIDVLVNSAGIAVLGGLFYKDGDPIKSSVITKVLNTNLIGTINVSKYVAQAMIEKSKTSKSQQNGIIINVASILGIEGTKGSLAYSISKGGIIGITLPMARDLGRFGVRVVCIAPSLFRTPMGGSAAGIQEATKLNPLVNNFDPIERDELENQLNLHRLWKVFA